MIEEWVQRIVAEWQSKSDEELRRILIAHDTGLHSAEHFEACRRILNSRVQAPPPSSERQPVVRIEVLRPAPSPRPAVSGARSSEPQGTPLREPMPMPELSTPRGAFPEWPKTPTPAPASAPAPVPAPTPEKQVHIDLGEAIIPESGDEVKESTPRRQAVEVRLENGDVQSYEDYSVLKSDILKGTLRRGLPARVTNPAAKKEPAWTTLEKAAGVDNSLLSLYRPVWAHTMKGLAVGALLGIVLKALDTTIALFSADSTVGFVWLIVVVALLVSSKWKGAWIAALAASIFLGVRYNLFMTVLAVMMVGAFFGIPAGMAVGTIVGYFRQGKLDRAWDAQPEGAKPLVLGFLIPFIFFCVTFALFLFWLNPKMMEWLSSQ